MKGRRKSKKGKDEGKLKYFHIFYQTFVFIKMCICMPFFYINIRYHVTVVSLLVINFGISVLVIYSSIV